MLRTRSLPAGKTVTLESFWNATATASFRLPAGVKISVKYGKGWLSVNRQAQTLDGSTLMRLSIGKGSIAYARMRAKSAVSIDLTYDLQPSAAAAPLPDKAF